MDYLLVQFNYLHRDNYCTEAGGGLVLLVSSAQKTPPLRSKSLEDTLRFNFKNCTLYNNTAVYGGGISLETSNSGVPTFGDDILIYQNYALSFGGGLYMETQVNSVFMTNATFEK
jgi:hypothetical protein